MTPHTAIEAKDVTKSFGATRVLDGVDLCVEQGTVFALLGPNGAGKTTTVKILGTLLLPDRGQATVAGHDVVAERHEVRRRISLTGQYAALDQLQTGAENLEMMARLRRLPGRTARVRARELLEQFDLTEAADRRVERYSGGMRRRLDLAASLIDRPEVIFLDEPTTGLDPRSRQSMWALVTSLADSGVTVLLTTQYLEEADQLADRIAVLDGGRIVAEGTADELKERVGGSRLELELGDSEAFEEIWERVGRGALRADRPSLTISVATDGGAGEVRALLDELDPDRVRIRRFSVETASLDDVFIALTGHHTPTTESEAVYV